MVGGAAARHALSRRALLSFFAVPCFSCSPPPPQPPQRQHQAPPTPVPPPPPPPCCEVAHARRRPSSYPPDAQRTPTQQAKAGAQAQDAELLRAATERLAAKGALKLKKLAKLALKSGGGGGGGGGDEAAAAAAAAARVQAQLLSAGTARLSGKKLLPA